MQYDPTSSNFWLLASLLYTIHYSLTTNLIGKFFIIELSFQALPYMGEGHRE